jgi:selenophosphate synthetase-related protein
MLLEPTRSGVAVDLASIPRPSHVPIETWLDVFPSFGFLLCVPERHVERCRGAFAERGLECAAVGILDDTGRLRVRLGDDEAVVIDLAQQRVTGLGRG